MKLLKFSGELSSGKISGLDNIFKDLIPIEEKDIYPRMEVTVKSKDHLF